MTTKPSKPTNVNVKKLQSVLSDLTAIQQIVNEPPPGSLDAVGVEIKSNLGTQTSDNGLTNIAGIDDVDKRYHDAVHTVTVQAWPDVQHGIGALITMLNDTILKHTTADTHAADGANQTNTGSAAGGRGGH
jgi:hypothetical protein